MCFLSELFLTNWTLKGPFPSVNSPMLKEGSSGRQNPPTYVTCPAQFYYLSVLIGGGTCKVRTDISNTSNLATQYTGNLATQYTGNLATHCTSLGVNAKMVIPISLFQCSYNPWLSPLDKKQNIITST